MEFLVGSTKGLVEFVFDGYTPKQKRDNVRFLHGVIPVCLVLMFIFSPSRSYARLLVIGSFIVFTTLFFTLKDCWVSIVEIGYVEEEKNDIGVVGPLINLVGSDITKETRRLTTAIAYIYTFGLMTLLTVRDMYGVY